MTRLKVGVVGAGHLGKIHTRLLAARGDVELIGVADPLAQARDQVARDCGTQAFADHRSLLDKVEAAVIATPTKLHYSVSLDFLRRGIHVLVEKPLAPTRAEAQALVEAAETHGAILQVGHVERFNPALNAAAPYLRSVRYIEAVRAGNFSFRSTDIGVVFDLMIHDLDVALSLVGSRLAKVEAIGLAVLGRHEDVAEARLEFENGCVANLKASRVASSARREMQLWTDYGFCAIDFAAAKATIVRPSEAILRRELDVERLSADGRLQLQSQLHVEHLRSEALVVEPRNAIADELEDFAVSIRAKTTPRVDGRQACEALAVAEQILDKIAHHQWDRTADGPIGPLATPPATILRGPHWDRAASHAAPRREAG